MKGFYSFIYLILMVFAILGSAGYLFWIEQPQFAVALIILGALNGLAYFGKITLPMFKDINESM